MRRVGCFCFMCTLFLLTYRTESKSLCLMFVVPSALSSLINAYELSSYDECTRSMHAVLNLMAVAARKSTKHARVC